MTRRDPYQADFSARHGSRIPALRLRWPVDPSLISRIGDTVSADRDGHGRIHEGLDIFVPAGTDVVSALGGTVAVVQDGRFSREPKRRKAGLFVWVVAMDEYQFRYLHLGEATVEVGQTVVAGAKVGIVAPPHTSGLAAHSHVHFEIRRRHGQAWIPVNPLSLLPKLRA